MTETISEKHPINKFYYCAIKGIALLSLGLILLLPAKAYTPAVFILTGLLYVVAGINTLLLYEANKDNSVVSVWLILEGVAETILGAASMLVVSEIDEYVTLFALWVLLFTFLQLFYIIELFYVSPRLNVALVGMRSVNGLLGGLIALVLGNGLLNEWNPVLISVLPLLDGIRLSIISFWFGGRKG